MNTSNTMHVFHCMAKMGTGGNTLYIILRPSSYISDRTKLWHCLSLDVENS